MRIKGLGPVGGLVLALSVPGAAAAAGDPGTASELRIRSGDSTPGSTVHVSTTACGDGVTYGKGESVAGGAFHLFEGDSAGELAGEFTIPQGAEPGTDTITVKCPPRVRITSTYEITTSKPSGAVDAGYGPADDTTGQLAAGGVLIAGGLATAALRLRRRPPGFRA